MLQMEVGNESRISEELAGAAILIIIILKKKNAKRKRKPRTVWMNPRLCKFIKIERCDGTDIDIEQQ